MVVEQADLERMVAAETASSVGFAAIQDKYEGASDAGAADAWTDVCDGDSDSRHLSAISRHPGGDGTIPAKMDRADSGAERVGATDGTEAVWHADDIALRHHIAAGEPMDADCAEKAVEMVITFNV